MIRYAGGRDLDFLRREMDRLFEGAFPARTDSDQGAMWAPRADLVETDEAYLLTLDLPGVSPDDLDVTFEEGALKISGERKEQREIEGSQYHRIERSTGRFFRSFRFGNNADPDKIEAEVSDGVLTVRLGKVEASKPRRIEVGRRDKQPTELAMN